MMEEKIELIENYLSGEMSVKEMLEFEKMLKADSELMEEFKLRKSINDALSEDDVMQLTDKLNDIADSIGSHKKRTLNPLTISSIAAVLIILITVSTIFFRTSKLDNQSIYEKYYQKYPSVVSSRSANEYSMKELFESYENGDYAKAEKNMKDLLENESSNYLVMFYLSLALIEQGKLNEAEKYLHNLVNSKGHIFWEQSNWYLALVYIGQNNNVNAKELLDQIEKENMVHSTEAKEILKVLN